MTTTLTLILELTDAQVTGIAQARTAYNNTLLQNIKPEDVQPTLLTDAEYMVMVNIGAANSYAAQYSGSEPVPPSPVVPTVRKIDARRLRLALLQLDLLATIEAVIASQGEQAQIEWKYATHITEDHPLVTELVTALSLDIDVIFNLAETFS